MEADILAFALAAGLQAAHLIAAVRRNAATSLGSDPDAPQSDVSARRSD